MSTNHCAAGGVLHLPLPAAAKQGGVVKLRDQATARLKELGVTDDE